MRAVDIRVYVGSGRLNRLTKTFKHNWIFYLQEALGLGIFMVSACFFGAILESNHSPIHPLIPNPLVRRVIMGLMMGGTALFIFYSPFTAPSGSHINPAVTLTFFRLGKMGSCDSLFYILFQFAGGLTAVYGMGFLMGEILTSAPVFYVVTVPGSKGPLAAALTELIIAFCMIAMILYTSADPKWKPYTRIISAVFVCIYVIITVPLSGFGMNPARTMASAIPANIYTSLWIYLLMPVAGMLLAAELFLLTGKKRRD